MAYNGEILVDISQMLIFPQEVAPTSLRPDLVLWSPSLKTDIMELTVPGQDSVEEGCKRNNLCHTELAAEAKQRDWNAKVYPVEVGSRGRILWLLLPSDC